MAIKPFVKANTNDISLTILQNNLDTTFNSVLNNPNLDGAVNPQITFIANQDTVIAHGLNRPYVGWDVQTKNNFGDIKLSDTKNTSPSTKIILVSNANMVVDLWIY